MARKNLESRLKGLSEKEKRQLFILLLQDFKQSDSGNEQDGDSSEERYRNPVDEMNELSTKLMEAADTKLILSYVDAIYELAKRIPGGLKIEIACNQFKTGDVTRSLIKEKVDEAVTWNAKISAQLRNFAQEYKIGMTDEMVQLILQIF